MSSSDALQIPRSVIKPVTSLAGVTSKAKLAAGLALGGIKTFLIVPRSSPWTYLISSGSRSSMGISFIQSLIFQSKVLDGRAT